ncbi:hypothetical protein GCM10027290_11040 [Micromonospora sonneratiae]|uniref:Uncharacterized protein n=1 Tax=Micromonospora sonneratiae TaxID=1184706 RepID=A0ABW3YKE5_9ACTN
MPVTVTGTDRAITRRLPDLLATHIGTATDVLRLLYVLHGGDPGLVDPPQRHHSLPRRVRRALLDRLDTLTLAAVAEDLRRHRTGWLHAAEQLHPFEQAHRHPRAAVAFAVLRRTTVNESTRLGRLLAQTAHEHSEVLRRDGNRLRLRGWAARVEAAMNAGDLETVVRLAAQRPGELLRRLVALAGRTDDGDALVSTVADAAPAVHRCTPCTGRSWTPTGSTCWTRPNWSACSPGDRPPRFSAASWTLPQEETPDWFA